MNRLRPPPHLMHAILTGQMEGDLTDVAPDGASAWLRFDGLMVEARLDGVRIALTLNGKPVAEYALKEWTLNHQCRSVVFSLQDGVTGKVRIEFKT